MPSETRHPYVAFTPNQVDFALQPFAETSTSSTSATTFLPDPTVVTDSRWQSVVHSVHEFISFNAGLLLVTAAQAVFSLVNVAVKMLQSLDEPVSTLELIIVRMGITYICSIAYMLIRKVPHPFIGPEGVRMLLGFRGLTGFIGLNGTYFSLQYLSLSDVTVLSFLVPMCTAISGSIFLKESFTRREAVAGMCSLFGVVLIARPEFLFGSPDGPSTVAAKHRAFAIGVALSGVVGSTGAMTSIRAIGHRAHPMHLLAFFSIQSVIAASIIMAILREPIVLPTRLLWLGLLAVIGILGFAAQILLTMGFQREKVGRASMALYTQIIFASILERIFFKTTPTILSLLGTLIIMSSAIYVAVTKERNADSEKPEQMNGINRPEDIDLEEGLLEHSKLEGVLEDSESGRPSLHSSR
ncbi:Aldo-keto reductase [Mycena sanguinolenta]|uniref:Aldo-keto reductase n=1 Tax=Mycena sanguinolenta TaxID=230812 RepID=A0A8H6YLN3_9AGAR|nr:Aldo-keto reductase [Mycena sanguinolenta]